MMAIYDAARRYAESGAVQDATPYERLYQEEFARQMATAQLNRVSGRVAYPRPLVPWSYGWRRYS
jgi:hypothetical protein